MSWKNWFYGLCVLFVIFMLSFGVGLAVYYANDKKSGWDFWLGMGEGAAWCIILFLLGKYWRDLA